MIIQAKQYDTLEAAQELISDAIEARDAGQDATETAALYSAAQLIKRIRARRKTSAKRNNKKD